MSKNGFKSSIASIPVLGYAVLVISNVIKGPRHNQEALKNQAAVFEALNRLQKNTDQFKSEIESSLVDTKERFSKLQLTQDNVRRQLSLLESTPSTESKGSAQPNETELFADDHILDKFYIEFEDRFRGSEELIANRQKVYLSYFDTSNLDFAKNPVLDIGSGRGEFLQLLKKQKIKALGLDINKSMVERANKKGFETVEGDALSHLQTLESQTYGAITGFHLVEHIPFNIMYRILVEAYRTLVTDGFVIFETPNPENLIVGANTFYMDPSHLHPLPPDLLSFALESIGFRKVEIKRLHPEDAKNKSPVPEVIAKRFFGPRDYAVIGYK